MKNKFKLIKCKTIFIKMKKNNKIFKYNNKCREILTWMNKIVKIKSKRVNFLIRINKLIKSNLYLINIKIKKMLLHKSSKICMKNMN